MKVENVGKSYGRIDALHSISFELYPGDILALLGDNGAGKSTLIKIIAGNHRADRGSVYLDGSPIAFASPAEARAAGIETVYQQSPSCVLADVATNFFIGRETCVRLPGLRVLRKRHMCQETEKAMKEIGVHIPSVTGRIGLLSGGERQAVMLGRFLHWGGKVALLDEPFAALGVGESRNAIRLIRRVSDQTRVPILVITHNVEYAFALANRFLVLRHGNVVGQGRMEDVTADEIVSMITGAICVTEGDAAA